MVSVERQDHRVDYEELARDLVRFMRGSRSQAELSQALGYSFNQVGKWESGHKVIEWPEFLQLADYLQIPVKSYFNQIFAFHDGLKLENASVVEVLLPLYGESTVRRQADKMHKSPAAMSRLKLGQVQPSLAEVLSLMDARPYVLLSWLSLWLAPERIPTLTQKLGQEKASVAEIFRVPESILVNAALHLSDYPNQEKDQIAYIMEKTALNEEEVVGALRVLLAAGWVNFVDGRYGSHIRDLTLLRVPEFRRSTAMILKKAAQRFQLDAANKPDPSRPSVTSSRIYPVSDQAARDIADAIVQFHHRVSKILKEDDEPKTHVRTVIIQSVEVSKL